MADVEAQLATFRRWFFAGEARNLEKGGCAGRRSAGFCSGRRRRRNCCRANNIRDFSACCCRWRCATYAGRAAVGEGGRIAGQFAKPRSSPTENADGVECRCYRGDIVTRYRLHGLGNRAPTDPQRH